MKFKKDTPDLIDKYYFGGLIAITLIIAQGFFTAAPLDTAQFISVIAFAVALPFLVCILLFSYDTEAQKVYTDFHNVIGSTAVIIDVIGITSAFWHISWIVGVIFFICSVTASFIYLSSP